MKEKMKVDVKGAAGNGETTIMYQAGNTYDMKTKLEIALKSFIDKLDENGKIYFSEHSIGKFRKVYEKKETKFRYEMKPKNKWGGNNQFINIYVSMNDREEEIYCFVERRNGNIYRPKSQMHPYVGTNRSALRGNVYDDESYEYADPYGTWLYNKLIPKNIEEDK